eukprot:SAG11_NODE_6286_length_1344_cov_0.997590_2_plen_230_part_01
MGLISSASFFQRWIESKLERHGILYRQVHVGSDTIGEKYLDQEGNTYTGFATVYLDDVVIFSRLAEEHKRHLVKLLEVLSIEGLHLQKSKRNMFCEMIQYLGAWVGNGKVYMSADKVRAILDLPLPNQNQTQIRGFLGMCSFYRRFISDFSGISRPLAELLKKDVDVPSAWTSDHTKSVNDLEKALTTYPVLRQYDMRKPPFLVTDASDYAIGSCLYQYEGTNPVAIAYA